MHRLAMLLVSGQLALGCAADRDVDKGENDPAGQDTVSEEDKLGELIDMSTVVDDASASEWAAQSDSSKEVFGKDMRRIVKDTSVSPYASTVMVRSVFPSQPGSHYGCTGTMIAPDAVLTAAHCVFNGEERGGRASEVFVSPGAYVDGKGKQRALAGVGTLRSTDFSFPLAFDDVNGFTDDIIPHDYAVIRLPKPVPSVGVRKLAALREPAGTPISMTAYHSDLCSTGRAEGCVKDFPLYVSTDTIRRIYAGFFEHRIDLRPFSSGAGISIGGENGPIVGVQSAEDLTANTAVRLTDAALVDIRRWANLRP